jgi:hypothetical protein
VVCLHWLIQATIVKANPWAFGKLWELVRVYKGWVDHVKYNIRLLLLFFTEKWLRSQCSFFPLFFVFWYWDLNSGLTSWTTPPVIFGKGIFEIESHKLLAFSNDPPNFCVLRSWDYRHDQPAAQLFFIKWGHGLQSDIYQNFRNWIKQPFNPCHFAVMWLMREVFWTNWESLNYTIGMINMLLFFLLEKWFCMFESKCGFVVSFLWFGYFVKAYFNCKYAEIIQAFD